MLKCVCRGNSELCSLRGCLIDLSGKSRSGVVVMNVECMCSRVNHTRHAQFCCVGVRGRVVYTAVDVWLH